ncbi:hypothetical protein J2Z65_003873 [Paenibacillus aceris]|uniref:Secreted protein n=1 Tax=Paenibacillus aceris TaxID=869555 RepID=A0ABS4I1H0_9BACL|nr:hypothetical protein [Paenibacillus aceris]
MGRGSRRALPYTGLTLTSRVCTIPTQWLQNIRLAHAQYQHIFAKTYARYMHKTNTLVKQVHPAYAHSQSTSPQHTSRARVRK